jgi:adenylate cyclase
MVTTPSRKLAVILHADVVDSTILVQKNESLAHERIQKAFQMLSSIVQSYGGTAHEIRGDALVAEFPRASDAVCAALSFQQHNSTNQDSNDIEDGLHPLCRIGISLGEVIVADSTITGAGVVLAQRLEQLANPGQVVVQGAVSETVPVRMPFDYTALGEQTLKGFEHPVRAFIVNLSVGTEIPEPDADTASTTIPDNDFILTLPDKPSIAVLPFTNMSSDPEQDYFSDGITEDIITAMSKVRNLLVVSSSSTYPYKGRKVDVAEIGREQGVRYVLEGAIRKSGNWIRVTAQLIDTFNGQHIWAERYDRELDDIFAVQDELMREIVVALDVELREGEQIRMWSSGTKNVQAWEYVRLSSSIVLGDHDGDLNKAGEMLEQALELDPDYAIAWVMRGWFYQHYADVGGGLDPEEERQSALNSMYQCAQKAIRLDPSCADAYSVMALYHMEQHEFEKAIENAERSITLAPNNAENLNEAAGVMVKSGAPERGLELAKRAMRVSPMYRAGCLRALAAAYRFTGSPEKAVDALNESASRQSDYLPTHVNLASVLGELGHINEAGKAADEVRRLSPNFSIKAYMKRVSYKNPDDSDRVASGLQRAGLAE